MKKLYLFAFAILSSASYSQVVLSQVYGGGGNNLSVYKNDFVELFNRGTSAVNIEGWSIQYASATGTSWNNITVLPSFSLQPGQYYLVQEAAGTGGTTDLPTPDFVAPAPTPTSTTPGIAIAGANFKIILANSSTPVSAVANPTDANIVDILGAGTANYFEGTVAPAGSNTTSLKRDSNGCEDTNDNGANFTAGDVTPRNSASPLNNCATAGTEDNAIAGLKVYPNPVTHGTLFIETSANADKAVTIFDIVGKQILNTKTSSNSVNVSNLKGGVYIVKITEDGKTATRKLIIK